MGCHRVKPGEVKPGNDGFGQAITIAESLAWLSLHADLTSGTGFAIDRITRPGCRCAYGEAISPPGDMLKNRVRFSAKDASCLPFTPWFLIDLSARQAPLLAAPRKRSRALMPISSGIIGRALKSSPSGSSFATSLSCSSRRRSRRNFLRFRTDVARAQGHGLTGREHNGIGKR
jgi:hypothetical protein